MEKRPSFGSVPIWLRANENESSRVLTIRELPADGFPPASRLGTPEVPFATQCHRCHAEQGCRGTCEKCLNEMRDRASKEMEVAVRRNG